MIKPLYGVKCLRLGFERYKRYCKLPITIEVSETTASFYVNKQSTPIRNKNARVSNHHPQIINYTKNNRKPWCSDNVSIEFIVPESKEDKERLRARVEQNAEGTILPFDVTVYQYDSTIIEPYDLVHIFEAIIVFLNGKGYVDPFIGTKKQAKVLPRHSNIKPYRGKKVEETISRHKFHEMAIYCIGDIYNKNKQINCNRNMKQTIRLTENELRWMINEAVHDAVAYRTKRNNENKRNNAVKLTESLLRSFINAAVNEALNEMDPRTYASARDKQQQRDNEYDQAMNDYNSKSWFHRMTNKAPEKPKGYGTRASKFNDKAVSSFNTQYSQDKSNPNNSFHLKLNKDESLDQYTRYNDDWYSVDSYDFHGDNSKLDPFKQQDVNTVQ